VTAAVYAFERDWAPAWRLAGELGLGLRAVKLRNFPDGESLPNVGDCPSNVLFYCSLDRPDAKLMSMLLAADALRRAGAKRLVLVVPYLPYMRQDAVFEPGEPLSRDVLGGLLGARFERIVTVEPHLHRTHDLTAVFGGTPVTALSAAPVLAARIRGDEPPLVVGPDAESDAWTAAVASCLGASHLTLQKVRRGDRDVTLTLPTEAEVRGRNVVLVDDICSTGATLAGAVRKVCEAGAASVDVLVVHALFQPRVGVTLRRLGARSLMSTDSCAHPSNAIHLAPLIASALREELVPCP